MNDGKIWDRPWSSKEIIENSENWSLAGDAALLNTIKTFANNILSKTDALNDNINELLKKADQVGLKLDISQNEFQSLKNTQFIESRVYDDDEALDSKENEKKQVHDDSNQEKSPESHFSVSLDSEIALLDKYYETVEISISDSEDESEKSFMLKPKDMYKDRQLPPLIGSDYWYKNWYLEDECTDVDSQKSSEVYSESDSDDNLPKDLFNGSETSSELDFSHRPNESSRPVANSTFKDSRKPELAESTDDSDDPNSLPVKAPISNFAEQLAAQLDNVISRKEESPSEINTKPILPSRNDPLAASLLSDEPPPLGRFEDKTIGGPFSAAKNLFDNDDEDEDSPFWNNREESSISPEKKAEMKDPDDEIAEKSAQVSRGLFDSDESDDDLFTSKPQNINKPAFLQSNKPVVPLFDEEPPMLDNEKKREQPIKKKPVGGISIFGDKDMGDILKSKRSNDNGNQENPPISQIKQSKDDSNNRKINLFDDDEDEDFFTKMDNNPKMKKINLFDDDLDNDYEKENNNRIGEQKMKRDVTNTQIAAKKTKVLSLFDDDDELSNDNDIFERKIDSKTLETDSHVKNVNLFRNEDEIEQNVGSKGFGNRNLSLFDDDNDFKEEKLESIEKTEEKSEIIDFPPTEDLKPRAKEEKPQLNPKYLLQDEIEKPQPQKKKKISLFDDDEEEEDDLFSHVTKKLDFKLFGDLDTPDDLFTIKKSPTKEENTMKNTKGAETDETSSIKKEEHPQFKKMSLNNTPILNKPEEESSIKDEDKNSSSSQNEVKSSLEKEEKPVIPIKPRIPAKPLPLSPVEASPSIIKHQSEAVTPSEPLPFSPVTETPPVIEQRTESGKSFPFSPVTETPPVIEQRTESGKPFPFSPVTVAPPIIEHRTESGRPLPFSPVTEAPPIIGQRPEVVTPPRPVISLFGSTPPPDDDDEEWERKSDNFSDAEDFAPYRVDESSDRRSNLFDNEPPSLIGDESSGICRDHSNTRIDTDESSFYPYASSSRRFSSDIFSDQQSQDSFFVTKNNKTEPVTNNQSSHLDIIPEDSKMTTIDVTPSGEIEESSTPEATPDKNDSAVSDGVFSNENVSDSSSDKVEGEKTNIKTPNDVQHENGKLKDNLDKSKREKSINMITAINERLKKQSPKGSPEKKVSPGKLKPTLNINVNALLPGYTQPKIKSITKTPIKDGGGDVKIENSPSPTAESPLDSARSDLSAGLDVTDNVDILHSITKERVRNPAKRRPSTRRGRQQALRASVIEDSSPEVADDILEDVQSPEEKDSDRTVKSRPIQEPKEKEARREEEKQKEMEIPRLPLVTKADLEKKLSGKKTKAKIDLFDSESETDDLFESSNRRKNTENRYKDSDGLFGSLENLDKKKESPEDEDDFKIDEDNERKSKLVSKKSLFDDSSSDDDLFSSKGGKKSEFVTPKAVEKKIKPAAIKKLENVETEEDPLTSLLK